MSILRSATVYEPDVEQLPDEFRSVLTEQDVAAIETGANFFATLARPDSPAWLRALLAECADSPYELQFRAQNGTPYLPYHRFHWHTSPFICLPRPEPFRTDLPAFLRAIYEVIGAFIENGFDVAGGLHLGTNLGPVSESGIWVEPGGEIDPATAIPFLETLAGSQLCYLPDGRGAWLEACEFRVVENLDGEVARYFEALLAGSRI